MEEGSSNKKTIFVANLSQEIDQTTLLSAFSTFGDVIDIQLPTTQNNRQADAASDNSRHRGFAFITFATQLDASDAIDNMDNNELRGSILRVNLAKPQRGGTEATQYGRAIWESEEWLKKNAKPVGPAGVGSLNPGNAEQDGEDAGEAEDAMEE